MNKRLLSIVLALTMLLTSFAALTSCDDTEDGTESPTVENTETEPVTEPVTEPDSEDKTGSETVTETVTDTEKVSETVTESDKATETSTETDKVTEIGSETVKETESETAKETESETVKETESETLPATEIIYENGGAVKDSGAPGDEDVFALNNNIIDESKAQDISAAELLELLKEKEALTENDVYRVTEPLVLSSGTKYYGNLASIIAEGGIVIQDVSDIVVKEIIIKGAVTIKNSTGITLFKLGIRGGDVGLSIDESSSDIAIKNCNIHATDVAIDSKADLVSIYCNYLTASTGLISTGDNLTIQDSNVTAIDLGISSSGQYCTVKNNTIELASSGLGVYFEAGSYNGLIALNIIKDAQVSVKVVEGFNCVVLLNSAIRIIGENTTNLYVVENKLGGTIELNNNKYLLCDGNTFTKDGKDHSVVNNGNTEFNGDNLQDVNARVEYGANEDILPHTNKDLFVGMERHGKVNDASLTKSYTFNNYIRTMARKNSVVIVPPGAYTTSDQLTIDGTHANTTVYAYGVYDEKDTLYPILSINNSSNVTFKGLTFGYVHQSSGQVYVLEKLPNQQLRVVTNAGYINDFGSSNTQVFAGGSCDMFQDESPYPWIQSVGYQFVEKCDDGTMILKYSGSSKEFSLIGVGDVLACRLAGSNYHSISLSGQNIKLKDCVLYGYAAALAVVSSDGSDNENVEIERFHNTVHSGYLIDEETYNWYRELEDKYEADLEVYIDEYGRYRGGTPRIGSVDATHIAGTKSGLNATSCILESMCDDGSNQRGSSSRLAGYYVNEEKGTTTLYFKGTLSQTIHDLNKADCKTSGSPTSTYAIREGDKIFSYASSGRTAVEGTALTDAVRVTADTLLYHSVHTDKNNDCICDEETCKALLHYDIRTTSQAAGNDGICDACGTKVYVDIADEQRGGDMRCNVTGKTLVDEDGDGINDEDGVPIITSMTSAETFNGMDGSLTYQILYNFGQNYIITYRTEIYAVDVKTEDVHFEAFEGYDFTDNDYYMDQKIIIDNISRNSPGFVFDNVLIRYTRSRGILVKTTDATIKNCTFRDHGMTAILLSVETNWGESTVPRNITIESCLFDNTGCIYGFENDLTHAPIAIQGLGTLSNSVEISEDTLPCKNIKIIGNKFMNIPNNYCITISAAQDITIKNNVFVKRDTDTSRKFGRAIYMNGCANINISGNTFSEFVNGDVTKSVIGANYIGLTGSDVVDSEGNRLLPEEKGPVS